ncbi:MAG: hypothetical protein PHE55_02750 [Methylococcaceae bacterium]|nr:hypothetical protein [Methylococcaceae bacterium]
MGLLEELKREAENARLAKEREEARQVELERIYHEEIRPRMLEIHRYLLEMIDHLNQVTWSVMASYDFPGIGKVENLLQGGYRISIDSLQNPKKIVLRFECVAPEERKYVIDSRSQADDASQFLAAQRVPFTEWPIRDGLHQIIGLAIQAKLRVWVNLIFEVEMDKSSIRVSSHNFTGITEISFLTDYQNIDKLWLDQLGHYILRKNECFGQLDISEEERRQIRQHLELERKQYELTNPTDETGREKGGIPDGILPKLRKILFKPIR